MKATATEATERSIPAEDALRLVIDTTPTPIHTARPDGYIDYFNKAWLEFFGKSLEDVRGWRWTDVVHPEDVAGIVRKWQSECSAGNGQRHFTPMTSTSWWRLGREPSRPVRLSKMRAVSGVPMASIGIPASTLESKIRSLKIKKYWFKGR